MFKNIFTHRYIKFSGNKKHSEDPPEWSVVEGEFPHMHRSLDRCVVYILAYCATKSLNSRNLDMQHAAWKWRRRCITWYLKSWSGLFTFLSQLFVYIFHNLLFVYSFSKISATKHVATPMLEFLSTLIRLPEVFCSFIDTNYLGTWPMSSSYFRFLKYQLLLYIKKNI